MRPARVFGPRILGLGLITLVSASGAHSQTPAPAGRIAGTVVASDNTPVARASVMVQSQRTSGTAPFRASVFTGTDGAFVVPDVPPGSHRI
ncbi:MAG: carboxypeptidase-like regulatory domain-containing protein, partial [Terriglobia bacterium]